MRRDICKFRAFCRVRVGCRNARQRRNDRREMAKYHDVVATVLESSLTGENIRRIVEAEREYGALMHKAISANTNFVKAMQAAILPSLGVLCERVQDLFPIPLYNNGHGGHSNVCPIVSS